MAQYPFDIDRHTEEGQLEILRLWSRADLDTSTAAFILKITTAEFEQIARRHGVLPPKEDALSKRILQLEARIRPHLRKRKLDDVVQQLLQSRTSISAILDLLSSVATEAKAYGHDEAHRSYSVAHARIRIALDSISYGQEKFEEARRLETSESGSLEYSDASIEVLRGLDRVVPRPDFYLIGDFNHVEPATERDVLWGWSQGFLATSAAIEMLDLEEGDTIIEIALQLNVPLPREEALLPTEAAALLGDEPVNGDTTFNVRRRIRDGRLKSY